MTAPRTDRDVDQLLTAWMEDVAPGRPPASLLEGTFARTMGATQVRRYPWQRGALGQLGQPGRALPRTGLWIALAALLLVAIATAAIMNGGGGLPRTPPPSPTPSPSAAPTATRVARPSARPTLALPAATIVTLEGSVPVQAPMSMVAGDTVLWILAPGRIDRLDPATEKVSGTVSIGSPTDLYNGIAASAAGVWATNGDRALLDRVDPVTLKADPPVAVGLSPKGVLATADAVWVADVHGGTVLRTDPASGAVVATATVGPAAPSGPNWLAAGLGSIWVGIPNNRTIARIDPATAAVQATIPTPNGMTPCGGFAVATTAVWITGCSATTTIGRVDPSSNTVVATVELGGNGYNPALIGGLPWISVDTGTPAGGMLVRIDPTTNAIDRVLKLATTFGGGGDIVVAAGSVWVVDGYNNVVDRLPLAAFTS